MRTDINLERVGMTCKDSINRKSALQSGRDLYHGITGCKDGPVCFTDYKMCDTKFSQMTHIFVYLFVPFHNLFFWRVNCLYNYVPKNFKEQVY